VRQYGELPGSATSSCSVVPCGTVSWS